MNGEKKMPDDFLLTIEDIMNIFKIGKTNAWSKVDESDFPERIRMSKGCTRWSNNEVQHYLQKLKSNRKTEAA